ncbi:hypothetical protein JIM95_001975 [Corynebacterium sp. CCM 8835]|uniref:hypothetical protein n=1 Tax=Corynebacterium antarcticum TaxID=2800405 RepID=UPI001F2D6EAC|nr:hypothetical protein [Corynebacterium antarcticum]MCK7641694.1 hypothetical protein [Corynebacterium antarcticum]MCK7660211.1 hypothetical protein [Corynebacterium antarcticum]MCL0244922.1 hypothetical protein [Corynebacterium antarcticum]MCX7491295.1 hypothetical protein [Corynebacterium antarcticum]MCX7539525.1 hypothetical protein [Corynebacterium antarcticum]
MATGRGDLRRQPGLRLAHDIREVGEQAANGPVPLKRTDLLDEHLESPLPVKDTGDTEGR